MEIAFDSTGSISHLTRDGFTWADKRHTLLQLKYRSYSMQDVQDFLGEYCTQNSSWIQHDYGKPGLPYDVQGKVWTPELKDLYVKEDADGCSFLVNSAFDPVVSKDFGAAAGWTQVDISDESINVSIGMFN